MAKFSNFLGGGVSKKVGKFHFFPFYIEPFPNLGKLRLQMQVRLILTILIMLNTKLHSLITDICCKAQPKQKPNHSWAVLVLNPAFPSSHSASWPKKYEAGTFEPGLQNKSY